MLIPEDVLKIGAADRLRDISGRHIHIEVAGENDRRVCLVPFCILKSLYHLSTPDPIVTSALEMQVIGNNYFLPHIRIGNECQPTSEPFLEWFDLRQNQCGCQKLDCCCNRRIRAFDNGQRDSVAWPW